MLSGIAAALLSLCLSGTAAEEAVWRVGAPILCPGPPGTFDETAVKDPTIVRHEGMWHLFYTARGRDSYSIGYVAADELAKLESAKRYPLEQLRGRTDPYAAAPQVFYFAPQERWYLVFQTRDSNYQPAYATTERIGNPDSWSAPAVLAEKKDDAKWIDFWVICDETTAYFFYTRNHKDLYRMTTALADFPLGFGDPRRVFGPVHEAVHIYRAKGRHEYHMLYETRFRKDFRRYGLATAKALAGPWTRVTSNYARARQLRWDGGAVPWTEEVSHGEMIRSGFDQCLEYDPLESRFLIQGMPASQHQGPYPKLPWSLGIIHLDPAPRE